MQVLNVYLIYDKVAGIYSLPICQLNHKMMERQFIATVDNKSNSKLVEPTDFELYYVGKFETATGKFGFLDNPEFITKGEIGSKEVEKKGDK